jgi:predicted nucleotidyltransferase
MKLSTLEISQVLKHLRLKHGKTLREVAAYLKMDQAILSKIENGKRPLTAEVLQQLASYYQEDFMPLHKLLIVDKLYRILENEEDKKDILVLLEERVQYQKKRSVEYDDIAQSIKEYFSGYAYVEEASLFGSFVRGTETKKSDLDVLIKMSKKSHVSMMQFLKMQHELSDFVGRKVDLVEEGQLKENAKRSVLKEKEVIYVKSKRSSKSN